MPLLGSMAVPEDQPLRSCRDLSPGCDSRTLSDRDKGVRSAATLYL